MSNSITQDRKNRLDTQLDATINSLVLDAVVLIESCQINSAIPILEKIDKLESLKVRIGKLRIE